MTTLGKSTSPSVGSDSSESGSPSGGSSWSFGGLGRNGPAVQRSNWSNSTGSLNDGPQTSLAADLWGAGSRNVRPPPGLPSTAAGLPNTAKSLGAGWQQGQNLGNQYSRSMSWAPASTSMEATRAPGMSTGM